jgi:hypothetical protein
MFENKNLRTKNLIKSIGFYVIIVVLFNFFQLGFSGNSHTPGLGHLFIILTIPVIFYLIFRNCLSVYRGEKENLYSMYLHLLVGIIGSVLIIQMFT